MKITNKNFFPSFRHAVLTALIACTTGCIGSLLATGDEEAVTIAARKYVAANSVVSRFHVRIEKIDGEYARVKVTPDDSSQTDAAWVFLKRETGVWRGLTMGTAFSPDDYKELHIPASVQL
jgi:hypothetical protein